MLKLQMMQTVAFAVVILYFGYFLKKKFSILDRFCIPAPVAGGFVFAILHLILHETGLMTFDMNFTLKNPFMLVFFASIGFEADLEVIKKGGKGVIIFFVVTGILCVFQNAVGSGLAIALGEHPLLGVMAGSTTMTGGHGTAAAWAETFENYGLNNANVIGMSAATFGLIAGSLLGSPLGRTIISKKNLKPKAVDGNYDISDVIVEDTREVEFEGFMKQFSFVVISVALGIFLSEGLVLIFPGFVLPQTIASLFFGVIFRNLFAKQVDYSAKTNNLIGDVALNVFLAMALIEIRLWDLKAVAGPLLIILISQAVLTVLYVRFVTFNAMGKDYDAAVIGAGHTGFGMGAIPNGIANMQAITEKFGDSQKAFFILPIVGMLVDFVNVAIITGFVNLVM